MGNWEKVYSTEQSWKAEIMKDVLEQYGLSPIIMNKREQNLQIGLIEILVQRDEVLEALKIIEDDKEIR